ncbi:MAG TPA: hypothetical protein PK406_00745 [Verrucomicrobiota bacterium]|nr:hypothetical protein [Verrucomicrobiota bacterium]
MTELLLAALVLIPMGTARLTWYEPGGKHAAFWHDQTPAGFGDRVDSEHLGIAAPAHVPFGTKVLLRRVDTGAVVIATVIDRTADGRGWDAWVATAYHLGFGPEYGESDAGVIECQVWEVRG